MNLIRLPEPSYHSKASVEEGLLQRRSIRVYQSGPLALDEASQLLWAAQGITGQSGLRTAPSAGALYPLELSLAAGNVDNLVAGVYRYRPHEHALIMIVEGDKRDQLTRAALGQSCIRNSPLVLVFCAVYERVTNHYGERGIRYVHMEVGHAAQNVHLQAISLNVGTVVIGAFNDREVKRVLRLEEMEEPLYLMPAGKRSPT